MSHLLSRRLAVLAVVLLPVLAGACSSAQAPAAGEWKPGNGRAEFKPFTFVHLGDPQIGFGRDGVENDHARLVQAGRQINAARPDFVYLAGDMTHKNLPRELDLLEDALKTFQPPLVATPGNHDAGTHEEIARFRQRWGKDYQSFTHNGCDFIVVNSILLSEHGVWFKKKDDRFLEEIEAQWKWLEGALEASARAGRAHVFLLMHVAPFLKSEQEPDRYENLPATARTRIMELARKHGVRAILCGHDHANSEIRSAGGPTIWVAGGTARVGKGETFGFHVWHVEKDKAWCELVAMAPAAPVVPATAPAGPAARTQPAP